MVTSRSRSHRARAFSLIELLVVMAVLSLLAALLFPVFLTARGKARQTACLSNLRQIGLGLSMYAQDYDGLYPYAVDPADRIVASLWSEKFPEFGDAIQHVGLLHEVLQPYVNSPKIFACPADSGFAFYDFAPGRFDVFPTSFGKYGTSYYYRTEIAIRRVGEAGIEFPDKTNVLFDPVGYWHGNLTPLAQRYNVLFADGHVKNLTRPQIDEAWSTPLNSAWDAPLPRQETN